MAGNVYVDALAGTSMLDIGRDRTVTYFFDESGSRAWSAEEKSGMRAAMQAWSSVANITFKEVATRAQADISEKLLSRDLMTILLAPGVTAYHYYPEPFGEVFEGAYSITGTPEDPAFNLDLYGVTPGSRNFQVILHEIGHGIGLAHPHDTDMGTGLMPGVNTPKALGAHSLNRNISTVMSYNDYGQPLPASGYAAGPMAFDIAAIQSLYGANTTHNAGNSVYTLFSGTADNAWRCIWDTGGLDTITYAGTAATRIDLRAATLEPGPDAAGYLSRALGANGGYTIAKGVVIENASGGSGRNTLIGNAADNMLTGNSEVDALYGGAGRDILIGALGVDRLNGGAGADLLFGGTTLHPNDKTCDIFEFDAVSDSSPAQTGRDSVFGFRPGIDIIDLATIDADILRPGNQAFVFIGHESFHGRAGELRVVTMAAVSVVYGDIDADGSADFGVALYGGGLRLAPGAGDFIL